MSGRVEGKVAFITGAARGQGRSHALRLAEEGASIIAVDLCEDLATVPYPLATEADLKETVRLVQAAGGSIIASKADVRDFGSLERAVADGVSEFGRLDIVSANAGILSMGPAHTLSEEQWRDMLDINLTGVWHAAKAGTPPMIAGGRGGAIILTSSGSVFAPQQNIGHYAASKHGVVGLMRTLALELAPHMIRVNSLHPTQVDTPMIINDFAFGVFAPDVANPTKEDAAPVSQAMNALPIPWIEPIDVSNALLFLASDEARYITGVPLPVDAGTALA